MEQALQRRVQRQLVEQAQAVDRPEPARSPAPRRAASSGSPGARPWPAGRAHGPAAGSARRPRARPGRGGARARAPRAPPRGRRGSPSSSRPGRPCRCRGRRGPPPAPRPSAGMSRTRSRRSLRPYPGRSGTTLTHRPASRSRGGHEVRAGDREPVDVDDRHAVAARAAPAAEPTARRPAGSRSPIRRRSTRPDRPTRRRSASPRSVREPLRSSSDVAGPAQTERRWYAADPGGTEGAPDDRLRTDLRPAGRPAGGGLHGPVRPRHPPRHHGAPPRLVADLGRARGRRGVGAAGRRCPVEPGPAGRPGGRHLPGVRPVGPARQWRPDPQSTSPSWRSPASAWSGGSWSTYPGRPRPA